MFPPSSPPKKYRLKTVAGRLYSCSYGGSLSTCHGNGVVSQRNEYFCYGTALYSVVSGAVANNMNYDRYQVINPGVSCESAGVTLLGNEILPLEFPEIGSVPATFPEGTVACGRTQPAAPIPWNASRTHVTYGCATDCVNCGGITANQNRGVMSTLIGTILDNEDDEDDALDRLLATATWGPWVTAGASGCTGSPPSCCLAAYQPRTTGFSFAYAETEWRMNYAGLTTGQHYTATVTAMRRPYGSGSYAVFQTITVGGTADGSGNLTLSGTVPNERGFQTYVSCP